MEEGKGEGVRGSCILLYCRVITFEIKLAFGASLIVRPFALSQLSGRACCSVARAGLPVAWREGVTSGDTAWRKVRCRYRCSILRPGCILRTLCCSSLRTDIRPIAHEHSMCKMFVGARASTGLSLNRAIEDSVIESEPCVRVFARR